MRCPHTHAIHVCECPACQAEMQVLAVSRQLEISDKRLWRIVHHYVGRMLGELDLSRVTAVGVDETASRRGQRYVTVFLDMQRQQEPVLFAVPGHGKATITAFSAFLAEHGGDPDNVVEVVFDMSQVFLSGVAENLPNAEVTVDWFHIVQTFTKAMDEVRKKERREKGHPKALRWAVLKRLNNGNLTAKQLAAVQDLVADQGATADAWVIKEKLRWIQKAPTPRADRWAACSIRPNPHETSKSPFYPLSSFCCLGRRVSGASGA